MDPLASLAQGTPAPQRRAAWLRQLTQWHWISSGVCLVGMLLFALTGITLNHPADIRSEPQILTLEAQLPSARLAELQDLVESSPEGWPAALRGWLGEQWSLRLPAGTAEWSDDELYVAMPRPGGDAWLSVDLSSGEVLYEDTDRGWVAYFNDLHKGRNSGALWRWFIDVFAIACIVFCVTGLLLLVLHARRRPATWPTVGLGLLVPLLIALLFIH